MQTAHHRSPVSSSRSLRFWPVVLVVAAVVLPSVRHEWSNSGAVWVATNTFASSALKTVNWTGPATQLVFMTAPQQIEDSTSGAMIVQEEDAVGNPVTATATVTVTLTSGSTNMSFSPSASVTIAAGSSTATFTVSDTSDTTVETITAASTGMVSATQTEAINAAGSHTTVTVGSQSGSLAPNGTATYSVTVTNCSGCNTHGYSLTDVGGLPPGATWSVNTACAAISGTSPSYTFTLTVTATTATPARATAYALAVTGARWNDTNDCNVSGGIYEDAEGTGSLTVNAGSASKIAYEVQPDGATSSGGVFPLQPKLAIEDAYGNVVTSASASVVLTLVGTGTLAGCTSAVATSSAVATFSGCDVTGTVDLVNDTFTATASGGFAGTAVSNPFDITGAASKVIFTTQPAGDSGTGGLSAEPVVSVEDSSSHVVTANSASIVIAPSSGTLVCKDSGLTVTASYGAATFGGCALTTAKTGASLSATSSGLTSATSSTFNVTISAPTVTAPSSGTPEAIAQYETSTFTVTGTNFAYGLTVADSGGNFTINGWTWTSATQISVTATCTAAGTDGLVVTNPDTGAVTAASSLTST